jgi:hypothetical protein
MFSQIKNFRLFLLPLFLLCSCEAEFNPNITTQPVPVVYGIISPRAGVYSVHLTKTFIGAGNALGYARIADSIYFPGARVFLETRDLKGNRIERVELEDRVVADRLPGIFATTPNHIFQTDSTRLHLDAAFLASTSGSGGANLYLEAVIPGYPDTVRSASRLRTVPRLTEPRYTFMKVYFYTEEPFWMQWLDTNEESYFEILVRMHYKDFYYDDEVDRVAEWVLTGISTNMTSFPGGERKVYSYYFRPENFYAQVRKTIPDDPEVEVRVCGKLDFIVLSSNREMEYFRNVFEISDDYHGAGYTNIQNGYGIFTTYSTAGIYGLELGPDEQDSLANGKYTKNLKFRNY